MNRASSVWRLAESYAACANRWSEVFRSAFVAAVEPVGDEGEHLDQLESVADVEADRAAVARVDGDGRSLGPLCRAAMDIALWLTKGS